MGLIAYMYNELCILVSYSAIALSDDFGAKSTKNAEDRRAMEIHFHIVDPPEVRVLLLNPFNDFIECAVPDGPGNGRPADGCRDRDRQGILATVSRDGAD